MKKNKKQKLYICIGENFNNNCKMGYCGDAYSLPRWIEILYGNKANEALEFFKYDNDKTITEYLYKFMGKRLMVLK